MVNKIGFHKVLLKTTVLVPLVLLTACAVLLICITTDLIADRVTGTKKISLKKRSLIRMYDKMIKPSESIGTG